MVCPFADTLTVVIAMTGLSRAKKKIGGRGHEGAKYPRNRLFAHLIQNLMVLEKVSQNHTKNVGHLEGKMPGHNKNFCSLKFKKPHIQ